MGAFALQSKQCPDAKFERCPSSALQENGSPTRQSFWSGGMFLSFVHFRGRRGRTILPPLFNPTNRCSPFSPPSQGAQEHEGPVWFRFSLQFDALHWPNATHCRNGCCDVLSVIFLLSFPFLLCVSIGFLVAMLRQPPGILSPYTAGEHN